MVPDDVRYTSAHEWVRATASSTVRVGITHFAQNALGDIVYVSLPKVGDHLTAGAACGEVESTKSVSDIYSPLSGTVAACNGDLDAAPETINADPYGAGWMFDLEPDDVADLDGLLTAAEYRALVEQG